MAIAKAVTEIGFPVRRFVISRVDETLRGGREPLYEILLPRLIHIKGGKLPVAGSQLFGKNKPAEGYIKMKGFDAGQYPVTVAEFRQFVAITGYRIVDKGAEELNALLADPDKYWHPVVFVNNGDREGYVEWLRRVTGDNWFILSAAQQEYLRRGSIGSGRTYPWGNDWLEAPYYNTGQTDLVDAWPKGVTPEGVGGLGIVWEATKSYHGDYDPTIIKDPEGPKSGNNIEIRGGSAWDRDRGDFLGAHRGYDVPGVRDRSVGFRLGRT